MNTKTSICEQAFKPKFIYPKLEDIQIGVSYALTINPALQKRSTLEQSACDDLIFELLYKQGVSFKVYPEISTKSTLWHYHGYITFPTYISIVGFYYYAIRALKDLCTFTIEPITTYDWSLYVRKQRHVMEILCSKNKIPYKRSHYNKQKKLVNPTQ